MAGRESTWWTVEEACGCTFRWHRPADFLVWPHWVQDLDAARPFDVRATVSPPRWCLHGQGTLQPERRPLAASVRSLCLQLDSRLPENCIFDARDSVELLDESLDHAVGMGQRQEPQQQRRRSPSSKPRHRRSSPSPSPAQGRTTRGARQTRGQNASERLHGQHAQSQKRLARKAAAEAGEMFSPRTNHSASPRSPAIRRAPSTPPAAGSPRRRVSAGQARRTSEKLYRQAQAKQADLKERQRQKQVQETKGLFTPRLTALDGLHARSPRRISTAEAYEQQMLAGERLHDEACAAQDRRKQKRVMQEQQSAQECTFTPDFQHFHGSGANVSTTSESSAEMRNVGDRLHEWATRKQVEHEATRRSELAQLRSQQQGSPVSAEQLALAGERLHKAACATQKRRQQEEMAAKSTFVPDLQQFHRLQARPTSLDTSEDGGEMLAVGDRLYASAQQKRKEIDEKRQAQEEKMLEELAQMGKPIISKKAQALERAEGEQPHYLKGTVISERRRPPDATGMQTSAAYRLLEPDADPGSWIEVEAAQQRRIKAAEAAMHRLHALEWQRCKREAAKEEQSVVIEEMRQKVAEEIVAKQRMAQVGVRKIAIGRLRPKIEPLLAEHEVEPPLEWDEVEDMILQLLSVYMRLTEVCEQQQLEDEPRTVLGHEWCRAVDENGDPVTTEDGSTVAMIDASLLDGALGNPESFFVELVAKRDTFVLRDTSLRRTSSRKVDDTPVEERLFLWAQEKEAEKTKRAGEALVQQISDLATKQKFQGKPTLAFATQHTESSVGKDKCAFVVERKGGSQKSTVIRFEAGFNGEGVQAARQKEAELLESEARQCRKKATPSLKHSFSRYSGKEGIDKHGRKIARELKAAIEPQNPLAFSFRVDHPLDGSFLTDRSPSFRALPKPATVTSHKSKPSTSSQARTADLHTDANGNGLGFLMEAVPPPSSREEAMTPEQKRQLEANWRPAGDQLEANQRRAQLMKEQAAAAKKRAGNAADNKLDAELAQAAATGAGSAHREATRIAAAHQDAAHQQAANIAEAQQRFAVRKELADQLTEPEELVAARLKPAVIRDTAGQEFDADLSADVRALARLEIGVAEHEHAIDYSTNGDATINAAPAETTSADELLTTDETAADSKHQNPEEPEKLEQPGKAQQYADEPEQVHSGSNDDAQPVEAAATDDLATAEKAAASDTEQHDATGPEEPEHPEKSEDDRQQSADKPETEHAAANEDGGLIETTATDDFATAAEAAIEKVEAPSKVAAKVEAHKDLGTISSGFDELENALQSWSTPSGSNDLEKELAGLLGAQSDSDSDDDSSEEDESMAAILAFASDDNDALSIRRSKPTASGQPELAPAETVGEEGEDDNSEQEDEDDDISFLEAALAEEDEAKAEAAPMAAEETEAVGEDDVPTRMEIECPEGSAPGDVILIEGHSGEDIEVVVPDDIYPGDTFEYDLEASADAETTGARPDSPSGPELEIMSVECPPGSAPGDLLEVLSPRGQEIEVVVPDGIQPGDTFDIELPG